MNEPVKAIGVFSSPTLGRILVTSQVMSAEAPFFFKVFTCHKSPACWDREYTTIPVSDLDKFTLICNWVN